MTGNTAITQCTRCRLHSLTQSLAQSPPTRHDYSPPPSPSILVIVAATHNLLPTIEAAPNWPVYADVFEHPPPRLASRRPVWSDMTSGFCAQPHYCYRPYYTIRQPGFHLPHHTWSLVNRFRTGQGPCRANLHKWGLAQSPSCDCGQRQTMNPIVDMCPLAKFDGGRVEWI